MSTHYHLHYAYLAEARREGAVAEGGFGLRVDSGLDCDTFNVVVTWRPDAVVSAADVEACRAAFGGRAFSWWVGPRTPAAVSARLVAEGLAAGEPEPQMAAVPAPWRGEVAGVALRRVETREALDAYAAVLAANWTPPDGNVPAFHAAIPPDALGGDAPLVLLAAVAEGRTVGTAELALGEDGVAGLYNVATLEAFRRRGIGEALTRLALDEAARRGMARVELQASELGQGVYRRVGFRAEGTWREHQPA